MPQRSDSPVSRRRFLLSGTALLGAGLVAACSQSSPAAPTAAPAAPTSAPAAAAPTAAPAATQASAPTVAAAPTSQPAAQASSGAAAPVTLNLLGWNYEPPLVQQNVDRFVQQNPSFKVTWQPISGEYLTAMIPKFQAKTPMDVVYVRGQYLAAWVDAGYISAVDDHSEWRGLEDDMYTMNVEAATYKGKHWGTSYYTDFQILAYNNQMLGKAGFDKAPTTLDELRSQSQTIKKQGIVEFPLELDWTKGSDSMWDYWTFVQASGGHLLDATGQPTYPSKDPVPLEVLKWWVAAANDWKIVDAQANMQPAPSGVLSAYRSGKAAFQLHARYSLKDDNAPEKSRIAVQGQINSRLALMPGLAANSPHYTPGYSREYGIVNYSTNPDGAWQLAYYMGGKDKTGQYYTAKRWWLLRSLGYVYKSLAADPEVIAHTKTFIVNPALMDQATQLARRRDGLSFPWWTDWYIDLQGHIQEAILKKVTPEEALTASAAKATQLAKQSS
jgi:multiple sugar transport system substrate-binding protein